MNAEQLIEKKRDGGALTAEEIRALIEGYTAGRIPDYQMAAWCMAVYFQGMTPEETAALTRAMADSGPRADLSSIPGVKVDKHSTGGVGDTITLITAPIAAAAGVPIAKLSGRSLGFTGGTVDKLSAIPGCRTALSFDEFIRQVREHGIAMAGQSADLCPADALLYALRDATGTVESLPLIASSVMSKKIASGADAVVLDVKCGRGAFMKDRRAAEALMRAMTALGRAAGLRVIAFVTDMNVPLGTAIGNSVEVDEAVDVLSGRGGRRLTALALTIAGAMICAGGKAGSLAEGRHMAEALVRDGRALAKFRECAAAQGGDVSWIGRRPLTPETHARLVRAPRSGYVEDIRPVELARLVMDMGGGRARKEDPIDLTVGLRLWKEPGDKVEAGEPLLTLYGREGLPMDRLADDALAAVDIGPEQNVFPLVYRMADSEAGETE